METLSIEIIVEIIGYVASAIIAVSMWMTSLYRLRWTVLIGNVAFIAYGLMIDSPPIYLLNILNALVNIYFLFKIYTKHEYFKLMEVRTENLYLINFLNFYKKEINKFFPYFTYRPEKNTMTLMILRNMVVAGVILAHKLDEDSLMIALDFAVPEYRDFKMGTYLYGKKADFFKRQGFKNIFTVALSKTHEKYLVKMGFREDYSTGERLFLKQL